MSAPLFDIVFRGDILPGKNLVEVKQRLAQLFKADEAKINQLFSGAAVPLKRNLEKAVADKYVAALNQAGADVQLMEAGKLAARQAKRPVQRRPVTPTPAPTAPAEPTLRKPWPSAWLSRKERESWLLNRPLNKLSLWQRNLPLTLPACLWRQWALMCCARKSAHRLSLSRWMSLS